MKLKRKTYVLVVIGILLLSGVSQVTGLETIQIEVNGTVRKAEIYVPEGKDSESIPVVFAFHGHGGTMRTAALQFKIEKYWPDALVIYPQGLNTPSDLVDPEGRYSGWQESIHGQSGRDISFFDSLMEYIANRYTIDKRRIYITGFSNGGVFTYVLWAARGNLLAAIAPIAGVLPVKEDRERLIRKPVFHVAGRGDPIVKFELQNAMINYIKKVNECTEEAQKVNEYMTEYKSSIGTPVITYINNAGHEIPQEAVPYVITFFKEHELNDFDF